MNAPMKTPDFTAAREAAFRDEIAEFVADSLPDRIRRDHELGRSLSRADHVCWQRKLVARGWGAPHWPEEWGGAGWSMRQLFVFEEAMSALGAPASPAFNTRMIGPILLAHGDEAQKRRFLPRALNFDDWWCQGYSEPGAGSDLASLQTRAVLDGDHYVVNGSKIWTSAGQHANWMFCLVRTDREARAQNGISFLLIDLTSPGVSFRPIRHFFGAHVFNQFFFDDVRVPVENRVGDENAGWSIAKALLEHERLYSPRHTEARRKLGRLRRLAGEVELDGAPAARDPRFRQVLARRAMEVRSLEYATMRALERLVETGEIGAYASVLKLKGIEINQRLDEAVFDLLGPDALPADAAWETPAAADFPHPDARNAAEARYWFRGPAIAGGSQEVQRGIIAKRILNM